MSAEELHYQGQTSSEGYFGDDHLFGSWLGTSGFEFRVGYDDGTVHGRNAHHEALVGEHDVGTHDLRLLDTEREIIAEAPGALEPFVDEVMTPVEKADETVEIAGGTLQALEYAAEVGPIELRVTVATDPPVTAEMAEGVATLLLPVELPVPGLPVQVQIRSEAAAHLHVELDGVQSGGGFGYETDDWSRTSVGQVVEPHLEVPAESSASAGRPVETAVDTGGDQNFALPGLLSGLTESSRTTTTALTASSTVDSAWLVGDGYFDEFRSMVNAALAPVSKYNVDLSGDTVDWWSDVTSGLDASDPRHEMLQRLVVLLVVTDGLGADVPDWVDDLNSMVMPSPNASASLAASGKLNQYLSKIGWNEYASIVRNQRQVEDQDLPQSTDSSASPIAPVELMFSSWTANNREPPELREWFVLIAALEANPNESFAKSLDKFVDAVWSDVIAMMGTPVKKNCGKRKSGSGGKKPPEMPGSPICIALEESERTFSKTIKRSDVDGTKELPSWVTNLAEVTVKANHARVDLPRNKLSRLEVVNKKGSKPPDLPVLSATASVAGLNARFTYSSRPAPSLASVVIHVATLGVLAALMTAAGHGNVTMGDIDLPVRVEPGVTSGNELEYALTPKRPSIGSMKTRLTNYVPTSVVSTAVASVWASNSEALASKLLVDQLRGLDLFNKPLQFPMAWPALWRLRDPPSEGSTQSDDIVLDAGTDSYARSRDVETQGGGHITVDRADGSGTTTYELQRGPLNEVDPSVIGSSVDAAFVFSRQYLEAWLLQRVGLLSGETDASGVLSELGVSLPALNTDVSASDVDRDAFDTDVGSPGTGFPGVRNCQPPSGPWIERERVSRLRRSTPIVTLPPDGTHKHGLEVQLQYHVLVEDQRERHYWDARIAPRTCATVAFGNGPTLGSIDDGEAVDPRIVDDSRRRWTTRGLLDADQPGAGGFWEGRPLASEPPAAEDSGPPWVESIEREIQEEHWIAGDAEDMRRRPRERAGSERGRVGDIPRPGPGPGRGRDIDVVCEPAHCEWGHRTISQTLTEYLDATVTVDAKIQTGFSVFGRYTANSLLAVIAQDPFRQHVLGDRVTDSAGWLPQLDLRLVESGDSHQTADLSTTVSIKNRGDKIANLDMGAVKSALATFCEQDVRGWLEPVSHQNRYPVTHEGGLVSPTGAGFIQAMFDTNALPATSQANETLSHLLRLVGQTNSTAFGTAPDHVVEGDYVYVPVDLQQDLTEIFK